MKKALILLAGGVSNRYNNSKKTTPKQYIKVGNENLIEYFLNNLNHKFFDRIHIVAKKNDQKKYLRKIKIRFPKHNIKIFKSGKTRQESSKNGVLSLAKFNPKYVLIHDVARPLASNKLIKRLLRSLLNNQAVVPFIKNNDLVKGIPDKLHSKIMNIQTPQAFKYQTILKVHKMSKNINSRDDTLLTESFGIKTKYIKGENTNFKITYKEDMKLFTLLKKNEYRVGIGYDIHKLDFHSKNNLILCGVKIPFHPLIGHSDADVGYHAVCDSILGALSLKDIGHHFNNKNKKWKNANSKIFVEFCKKKLDQNNYCIVNLDINFICEKPKINIFINKMKNNLSKLLKINNKQIAIKATTNEKIGFIGKGEGIAAEAIVQIKYE